MPLPSPQVIFEEYASESHRADAWRQAHLAKERKPPTALELQPFDAAVALCPRWSWPSKRVGILDIESRLHYLARLSAVAAAAPHATYHCGVRTCEACNRAERVPAPKGREPGADDD